MNNPLVSIVMPVYNGALCLRPCIDSLLCQTMTDFQLICVDDGSTDDTPQILADYVQRDQRVRVLTQLNQGAGPARNNGFSVATGEYLIFLDADDLFEPNFLQLMYQRGSETGADVVVCRSDSFDHTTGEKLPSDWMRKDFFLQGKTLFSPKEAGTCLLQVFYGWPWDKMFRREFLERETLEFPALAHSEDVVLIYGALAVSSRIALVEDILVHYRLHQKNSRSASRSMNPEEAWRAIELIAHSMQEQGLCDVFEQTFLNWVMDFSVWHISGLTKHQQQQGLRDVKELALRYQLDEHPRSYYHSNYVYYRYKLARYAPHWVFALVVRVYQSLKAVKEKI